MGIAVNTRKMLKKKKTYADFVAPLQKMVSDLKGYIEDRNAHIEAQERAREIIEQNIKTAGNEIKNSQATIDKLSDIIVVD